MKLKLCRHLPYNTTFNIILQFLSVKINALNRASGNLRSSIVMSQKEIFPISEFHGVYIIVTNCYPIQGYIPYNET